MEIDERRKNYLIAKALWEFIAQDSKKPSIRQNRSTVHDMEAILDSDYPELLSLLMRAEKLKGRSGK